MNLNKHIKIVTYVTLVFFFGLNLITDFVISGTLFPDNKGGAYGPNGYYCPDKKGGLWGPDGRHYYGIEDAQRQLLKQKEEERRRQEEDLQEKDMLRQEEAEQILEQEIEKERKKQHAPPSLEQIINRAWRKSEGYRRFKMGTISKMESESAEDYNKWVKQKEERAKRSWIKRCKSGLEKDCWVEPPIKQKIEEKIVYERKQGEPKGKDVSWVYSKKKGNNRPADSKTKIRIADPSPIRKEKKNGVWKFSN